MYSVIILLSVSPFQCTAWKWLWVSQRLLSKLIKTTTTFFGRLKFCYFHSFRYKFCAFFVVVVVLHSFILFHSKITSLDHSNRHHHSFTCMGIMYYMGLILIYIDFFALKWVPLLLHLWRDTINEKALCRGRHSVMCVYFNFYLICFEKCQNALVATH